MNIKEHLVAEETDVSQDLKTQLKDSEYRTYICQVLGLLQFIYLLINSNVLIIILLSLKQVYKAIICQVPVHSFFHSPKAAIRNQ